MDIRLLSDDDIPQAKALWKEAFNDSDSFIEWYFDNKVLPGNSLGIFDSSLISVLHTIPYTLSIRNKPLKTAFIAGAATSNKRRNEGLMRILLKESIGLMKSRGILMTHLYPFKHSFYEKFGWASYSFVNRKTAENAYNTEGLEVKETDDINALSGLYNDMMSKFDGYVIRGEREWNWRIGELKSDGGRIAAVFKDGNLKAYMMFFCENDKIDVIETVYSDDYYIKTIFDYLLSSWHMKVEYFIPANPGNLSESYGMSRIVSAYDVLKEYGFEGILDSIRVEDGFAEWNNIGHGDKINISDLAVLICGGVTNRKNNANKLVQKFGYDFLNQNTCIFEAY